MSFPMTLLLREKPMRLEKLLAPWIDTIIPTCEITGLQNDSRRIKPGDLFVAYKGTASDGRLYIEKALQAGAKACVYDPLNMPTASLLPDNYPCVPVPNLAQELTKIAALFYDTNNNTVTITGVTGTNGKTTVCYQLTQAHELLRRKAAYIGTIGQGAFNNLSPLDNTTPDTLLLQKLLHEYQKASVKEVCMEVSSHALSQGRVDGIRFQQAIFTNLTHDHLDYHRTMEHYAEAKARLFAGQDLKFAIINQDDPYAFLMKAPLKPSVQCLTYGLGKGCDVTTKEYVVDLKGSQLEVISPWGQHALQLRALGQFNIMNGLAIFSSLLASGYDAKASASVMQELQAVPGRMEVVMHEPCVLVDYAHTPDALLKVLQTLTPLKKGRLWVVFGCGGDRDKTKRPLMGRVASEYGDVVIITSDNPRGEAPEVIMDEIAEGIVPQTNVLKIMDRKEAIYHALHGADTEDIIVIAGKGHETYQIIGTTTLHFSDQETVRSFFKKP